MSYEARTAAVRAWVESDEDCTMSEQSRGVRMTAPGVVLFPAQTDFQQDKLYSVINATEGGSVTVVPASGEHIYVGNQPFETYEMSPTMKSVDFSRKGTSWWAQ